MGSLKPPVCNLQQIEKRKMVTISLTVSVYYYFSDKSMTKNYVTNPITFAKYILIPNGMLCVEMIILEQITRFYPFHAT